ncbi:adenine nucleotide alpha hydrolase [Algoriphagus aestuariicola]|uniref:Adenine nucleotide alpha hydrolase n=1 Tax=Algoriphagus aestuariicola TaxID=1852016 RepID=A0ABS3BKH7_9BACT|nr:adenine nucleotide alpha hydrolase [Algoriphagus aestuariicola]MBN7799813.1 adenine nucleotide alpha hydrolase [Algoriphagus aestuariicola]
MSIKPIPISLSWSGGKDSAFALFHLLRDSRYEVKRLHTTLGEKTRRVGMHGIAEELVELQAESLGLPLDKIYYPASGDNLAYEKAINAYLDQLAQDGIRHLAYGDIFLEDLRKYRESNLASRGFSGIFPLWKWNTAKVAREFIEAGFKSVICAADADLIDKNHVGKDFDLEFLAGLPADVDPCGENGEFHSFCYAGPIFENAIPVSTKNVVEQSYDITLANGEKGEKFFWFAEIVGAGS